MEYIKLMRVHQWVKNGFIFLPLFFALHFTDSDAVIRTATAALGFSLCASAIYILNDWRDLAEDKLHPTKRNRPLASGKVPVNHGIALMFILLAAGGGLVGSVSITALYFTTAYIVNNLLYSLAGFKHIPLLDITMISLGFVLRLFVGEAVAGTEAPLSKWIILLTFLLALFLGLAKRRDDVLLQAQGKKVRKNIDGYNLEFINGAMILMASVTVVAYISYTVSAEVILRAGTDKLYYTVFWVILGVLRYMQITFVEEKSGSPTKILFKDIFLQLTLVGWIGTFSWILYWSKM